MEVHFCQFFPKYVNIGFLRAGTKGVIAEGVGGFPLFFANIGENCGARLRS